MQPSESNGTSAISKTRKENVIQTAPPWSDRQPNSLVPKFQHLQLLAIFGELAILFLYLFPWAPSPRATPGNCHDPMDLQLPFNSSNQQVPKVDPTLRWSMSWTSSSTCPWLHSSGGFTSSEKTWMTKLTLMNFKDLGKIIGPSHSLIMPCEFLFFFSLQFTKTPTFPFPAALLQHPILGSIARGILKCLGSLKTFPSESIAQLCCGNLRKKTEILQTFQLEPTSALELHSLKQTASLGDEACLFGKHYL